MQVLFDYVIVRKYDEEVVSEGGIVLPQNVARPKHVIVEAGPDCKAIKKNDVVVLNGDYHEPITIDGKEYFIAKEKQIVAVLS